MIAVS